MTTATGPRRRRAVLARSLHPGAWWAWAICLAASVSLTTNPLVLALTLAVLWLVVVSRRSDTPWGRAFRLYVTLGIVIVVVRIVLHVLVGLKYGDTVLLDLPTLTLPSWAAGITLLGTLRLESLLGAALEGLRLATMICAIGAANALANPKRLLASLPSALNDIGSALVVAVSVAPQLAESVQRVMRARRLRGDGKGGLRAFRQVAMPVLQDTLDRSLLLAAAMDARGFGRRGEIGVGPRRVIGVLSLGGLLGVCLGVYGLLDASSPSVLGLPALVLGLAAMAGGIHLGGRAVRRTRYRPDPWLAPEWITVGCGVVAAAAAFATAHVSPEDLQMPLQPLAAPAVPLLAVAGLLVAALPAFVTPEPPTHRSRPAVRQAPQSVSRSARSTLTPTGTQRGTP
ncbi:energy-coupling factor transporter transmembrane component T [Janibacter sp. G56]|uniref:energy-coupling factor transporter transmembrane component T n=1 Tax=Janibacter sp. G56 TaxID=3418717 RepID=UPI003D07A473